MSRLYHENSISNDMTETTVEKGKKVKSYFEKLSSIIPAEIIAGYLAMVGFLDRNENDMLVANQGLLIGIFVFCLILTPLYFYFQATKTNPKFIHILMSTVAFGVWAFVTSGEKFDISFYETETASVILVGFSLLSGLIPMKK